MPTMERSLDISTDLIDIDPFTVFGMDSIACEYGKNIPKIKIEF